MKPTFLITLTAAALMLAGCTNNEAVDWNGEIRLTSGLDVQQVTRAATGIQSTRFEENESIDVFISEATDATNATTTYEQPLVYTTGTNGAMNPPAGRQPYFPPSGLGVNIYAYYPSGAVSSLTDPASVTFTVQTDQSDDANYKKSDLMYGKPASNPVERNSSSTQLNFAHLLSKVTVTLQPGSGIPNLDDATVTLKSVLPCTTLAVAGGTISAASGNATDITVLKTGEAGSAIVVPQTLPDTFIEVTLATGDVLTSDLTDVSEVTFAGGKEYKYEITVNLTSLAITSSISEWGDGGSTGGSAEM